MIPIEIKFLLICHELSILYTGFSLLFILLTGKFDFIHPTQVLVTRVGDSGILVIVFLLNPYLGRELFDGQTTLKRKVT